MEIIIALVVAVLIWLHGMRTGWNARERHATKIMSVLLDEIEKEEFDSVIHITIEQQDGIFYVYNKTDNSFMVQGKNKVELEEALVARFPGKRFAASPEELEKAGLIS